MNLGKRFDQAFRDRDTVAMDEVVCHMAHAMAKKHYSQYPDHEDIAQETVLWFCDHRDQAIARIEKFYRPIVGLVYVVTFRFRKIYHAVEARRQLIATVPDGDVALANVEIHRPKSWHTLERACCADSARKYIDVLVKSADQFRFPRYRAQYLGLVERWIHHRDEEMPKVPLAVKNAAVYWMRSRISILDTVEAMSR